MSAASVTVSTAPAHGAGPGSTSRAALHAVRVQPVSIGVAKGLLESKHYLHSLPGGTCLAFGVFLGYHLLGALTLGVGPYNAPSLVAGAATGDCLTLSRLWLADDLPHNGESRVIGIALRSLRRHTDVKFVLSYADSSQGHLGTIYQATGWLYTGLSEPTPLYDLGDGHLRHCRSVATFFGTRSVQHLSQHGLPLKLVPQVAKHRYVFFLDPSWLPRLKVRVLPYPKREDSDAGG